MEGSSLGIGSCGSSRPGRVLGWAVLSWREAEVLVLVEVFGFIILALSACYTYCVWRRIPFAAAANLNTGMMAVKANGRIFIMAYVSVALLWGEYLRISRNGWKL